MELEDLKKTWHFQGYGLERFRIDKQEIHFILDSAMPKRISIRKLIHGFVLVCLMMVSCVG